ncbi:MAG: hypothetical protein KAW92_09210 [Candidatus Cloacimonetes bacterium]|nr:hypothetical protein [Candidatus Cloacimonadota bacterium]
MKKILSIIREIFMWVVIILAFSALGLGSDNPSRSALILAIVAVIIFAIGFVVAKHSQRHTVTTRAHILFKRIFGIILLAFGCILPNLVLSKANFAFTIQALIFVFALLLIALGAFAVFLIRKGSFLSFLGYILLIIGAFLPALAMASYDISYNALGTVYYLLIALALFSWVGISMIAAKKPA